MKYTDDNHECNPFLCTCSSEERLRSIRVHNESAYLTWTTAEHHYKAMLNQSNWIHNHDPKSQFAVEIRYDQDDFMPATTLLLHRADLVRFIHAMKKISLYEAHHLVKKIK